MGPFCRTFRRLSRSSHILAVVAAAVLAPFAVGCGDETKAPALDAHRGDALLVGDGGVDGQSGDGAKIGDAGSDQGPQPCPRLAGPADKPRFVVVSHPFAGAGQKATDFEVLALSSEGALTSTGTHFSLGVAVDGDIVFTPDGEIGVVAQDDGTLGVFRVNAGGTIEVIHAAFTGSFYAARVVASERGDTMYVLDSQWRNNGGGIYRIRIGCDGKLTDEGLIAASKLPYAMALLGSGRALVAAQDLLSSQPGHDAHVLDLDKAQVLAGADAFGDDEAIVSDLVVTHDGRHALLADNSAYSTNGGNRVAVVAVDATGGSVSPVQILKDLKDPVGFAVSPYDNAALVLGAQADSIWVLDYAPQGNPPFALRGKLTATTSTLLPSVAVMLERGKLTGRVLIAENVSLRQVQFKPDGSVEEIAIYDFGSGVKAIPGVLGVQP